MMHGSMNVKYKIREAEKQLLYLLRSQISGVSENYM